MSNLSIPPKLSQQLAKLALKRTRVLSDRLWSIENNNGTVTLREDTQADKTVDIVILGKEHYSEQNRSFPIQSKRELNKILALEAQNAEGIMLYSIGDYVDGQRNVLCWQIAEQVMQAHQLRPLMIVPESALILHGSDDHLYSVSRNSRRFWFVRRGAEYLSAESKGLINNDAMFLTSAGLGYDTAKTELEADYAGTLCDNLLPVVLRHFTGLQARIRRFDSIDWTPHIKYSGTAAVLLAVGYFSLTSFYLQMRLESAQQMQSELSGQTKEVFELQSQLAQVQQKAAQLNQVTSQDDAPNVIWRFLVPLLQKGVTIKQVNILPSGLLVVTAEYKKATDVLEIIAADPLVSDAQFRGQTATINDKERFSVGFKIKREP